MLNTKKLLTKILDSLKTNTVTPSFTTSTGTMISKSAVKCGKMVMLTVNVRNTSSVAASSSIYYGNLTTASLIPAQSIREGTGYGTRAIGIYLGTDGDLRIYNNGSNALTMSSSDSLMATITYLTA